MNLARMYTHNYSVMDQYGDLLQLLRQLQIDVTDFESFPWEQSHPISGSGRSEPANDDPDDSDEGHLFPQALALARALHYYIDLGFHRVAKPQQEQPERYDSTQHHHTSKQEQDEMQSLLRRYPKLKDPLLVTPSLIQAHNRNKNTAHQDKRNFLARSASFLVDAVWRHHTPDRAQNNHQHRDAPHTTTNAQEKTRAGPSSASSSPQNASSIHVFASTVPALPAVASAAALAQGPQVAVIRTTSEMEYGYQPDRQQPWESATINPHRVGLGIANAMSQLCFDRTQMAWRYGYGEWVEIRST